MSAGTQEGRGEISMQAQHDASWDRLARAIGDIGERPRSLSAQTELSLAVTSLGSVTKTLLSRLVATGQERDTLAANLTSAIRAAERIATQHGETQAALTKAEQERDEAVKRAAAFSNALAIVNSAYVSGQLLVANTNLASLIKRAVEGVDLSGLQKSDAAKIELSTMARERDAAEARAAAMEDRMAGIRDAAKLRDASAFDDIAALAQPGTGGAT